MACYAVSLTSNETIFCKSIKASTVNLYISDAAKLAIFNNHPDPTKNSLSQKSSYITNVVNEHKRWELMPNRREPLTYMMVDFSFLQAYGSGSAQSNDSIEAALTDWLILGMQTGMRKSEWCQDRHILNTTGGVIPNRDGSPSAFILSDFTFARLHGVQCDNSRHNNIADATIVKLKWRFQKNNNNGEVLSYMVNNYNQSRCPVRAAMRIRARAVRLQVPPTSPIAVFRNQEGFLSL